MWIFLSTYFKKTLKETAMYSLHTHTHKQISCVHKSANIFSALQQSIYLIKDQKNTYWYVILSSCFGSSFSQINATRSGEAALCLSMQFTEIENQEN